jgi:hypothetical protein
MAGELVQFDCFHIGRLSGMPGRVSQYTAIDVASSFTLWVAVSSVPFTDRNTTGSALTLPEDDISKVTPETTSSVSDSKTTARL